MKHIVKKTIGLSLVLLLLVALLPVGVLAAENETAGEDTSVSDTAPDNTTNDSTTNDSTADDTTNNTTGGTEETPSVPEGDESADAAPKEDMMATLLAKFLTFFAWFVEQVNKFFSLM